MLLRVSCLLFPLLTLLLLPLLTLCRGEEEECGYNSCPALVQEKGAINVHIVAHSHDDVGWLKTVDQYYQGSNRKGWVGWEENQRAGVQYTIDTVVQELAMDPEKKFIQVETAFFWRWWRQQDEETKDVVKMLVNQGQLEFVGGGWSMNDEGASHYAAVVDQMSLGLRILNDTFGTCGVPKVGWQIDPFGHSKEQAALFARMGMDGLFFARLDWRDKTVRKEEQTMEMVWEASQDIGAQGDLFTGVLYDHYGPPPGFCWDLLCNDQPIMDGDNLDSQVNNLANLTRDFVEYVRKQASHYRTNNVMLTMGMDFHYQAAHSWFMNLDKLISHVNSQESEGLNLFYSSPSCYLKSLHQADQVWPTKQDDFFPYASDPHAYWTGYFSSRPTSKWMMRQTERMWKVLSQQAALLGLEREEQLRQLQETVGIVQHHDAITGTEKQHVANDYHRRMHQALETGSAAVGLTPVYYPGPSLDSVSPSGPHIHYSGPHLDSVSGTFCPLLNISQCPVTEGVQDMLTVSVYNQLGRVRSPLVRLPVSPGQYSVSGPGGEVQSQLVPLPPHTLNLPGRDSLATQELLFRADDVPALGSLMFTLTKISTEQSREPLSSSLRGKLWVGRGDRQVMVEHGSSYIHVRDRESGLGQEVDLDLLYYKGHRGNNSEFDFRASGAYIFRPEDDFAVPFGDPTDTLVSQGPLVDEIHRVYSEDWVSQVVRLYHDTGELEVQWMVGPIPVEDGVGKEVIARYTTDIESQGVFYTDSTGRQMMRRERDWRPTFQINQSEPVAQNYYPVVAGLMLRDPATQLTVLTDRSQGGGSIADGSLELMLHRRLLDDDAFGVGEALNETAFGSGLVSVGTHRILIDSDMEEGARNLRLGAQDMFHTPLVTFGKKETLPSGLSRPLPDPLHLLSLQEISRPEEGSFLLLQLEHLFQEDEHLELSQALSLDLGDMFSPGLLAVEWVGETSLGGNMWVEEMEDRLTFLKDSNEIPSQEADKGKPLSAPDWNIVIRPMEIRTFIVKVQYNRLSKR